MGASHGTPRLLHPPGEPETPDDGHGTESRELICLARRCTIGVIGGGSWGTALAIHLARLGHIACVWDQDPEVLREIRENHRNERYIPGVVLPEGVQVSPDAPGAVAGAELLVLAVPACGVAAAASGLVGHVPPSCIVVSATKGLCPETGRRMSQVAAEALEIDPERIVALSGPNLALEVVAGVPTATVVSGPSSERMRAVRDVFAGPTLRVYTNPDMIGVELGGALKNVMAIGAGVNDGLGFGDNTKATLITRGLAEMTRIGVSLGALPETFRGLAGLGDLLATSVSTKSRNYRVGFGLGQGRPLKEILQELGQVAEGIPTAAAAARMARNLGVEAPITDAVHRVIEGKVQASAAVAELMGRALKDEIDQGYAP